MNVAVDWMTDAPVAGELDVSGVHLMRGGRRVLQDVSLRARPGRVLALIGPNGAGKSSLCGVMAGLMTPSIGSVTLDGTSLSRWGPVALSRRRAMLSQHVELGFPFLADEVVQLGRSQHGSRAPHDRDVVEAALSAAHAWHLRNRSYLELSGGEKQRVQLARVLAQVWDTRDAPAWLLLDEPEAGLDIAHQHFILQRARDLTRRGFGVITVLHDLNLAMRYADDVALLAQGRLLRHGSALHALDPQVLSTVYGIALRRHRFDDTGWMLMPA